MTDKFDSELELHRKKMEADKRAYSGQHASAEVQRIRDAVWFLLAVAHQPEGLSGEEALAFATLQTRVAALETVDAEASAKLRELLEAVQAKQIEMPAWLKMTTLVDQLVERVERLEKKFDERHTAVRTASDLRKALGHDGLWPKTTPDEAMAAKAEFQNMRCVACGSKEREHNSITHKFVDEYTVWYLCPLHHLAVGSACCEAARRQEPLKPVAEKPAAIYSTHGENPHDYVAPSDMATARERAAMLRGAQSVPTVVCLCGSTRFGEAFRQANLEETLKGNVVLTVGSMSHSDADIKVCVRCMHVFGTPGSGSICPMAHRNGDDGRYGNTHRWEPLTAPEHVEVKKMLDALHKRKIDMADEVFVLNVIACGACKRPQSAHMREGFGWACGLRAKPVMQDEMQPYIGESTRSEIAHALRLRKPIRFLNPMGPRGIRQIGPTYSPRGGEISDASIAQIFKDLGLEPP